MQLSRVAVIALALVAVCGASARADVGDYLNQPVGTVDEVFEQLAPYVQLGYRHLIAGIPATYDEESMRRLVTDVKPRLEKI